MTALEALRAFCKAAGLKPNEFGERPGRCEGSVSIHIAISPDVHAHFQFLDDGRLELMYDVDPFDVEVDDGE